jgi:hypothetical protein
MIHLVDLGKHSRLYFLAKSPIVGAACSGSRSPWLSREIAGSRTFERDASLVGAGDRDRTGDIQLGKLHTSIRINNLKKSNGIRNQPKLGLKLAVWGNCGGSVSG